jgi:hypothetical protein
LADKIVKNENTNSYFSLTKQRSAKMKLEITAWKWFFSLFLMSASALANAFTPPPVGTQFFLTIGNEASTHEVISTQADRFITRSITAGEPRSSEMTRFLGMFNFNKRLNEGIFAGDSNKALALFPLKVGNRVTFSHYGGSGNRWHRDHIVEVVSEQTAQIGQDKSAVFSLKIQSESPGFMKLDGVCDFAPQLGTCIRFVGDLFVRGNSALTGPMNLVVTKVILNGTELVIQP